LLQELAAQRPRRLRMPLIAGAAMGLVAASALWFFTHRSAAPRGTLPALQSLEVRTDPPGVTVRIGSQSCVSPGCDFRLAPGMYELLATRDGYQALQRSLRLEAGKQSGTLTVTLTPVPPPPPPLEAAGELRVRTNLPDTRVLIDGVSAGLTDAAGDFSR